MAKSVLELAVGTGQWDAGLKKARTALDNFTQANGGLQSALNKDSKSMQTFVQMMGKMDSQAKTAKGQMNDYKGTIEQLTMQYNRLTDAQKKTIGQDYLRSIDQMKQKYQGVAEEVAKINQELKQTNQLSAGAGSGGGGGLFSGDKLSGMLQVFGGNVMTKIAGAGVGFVSELGDMVKQGIELARAGEGVRIAFQRLGRGDILDGLREATHGTVSDLELMKAAVKFQDFKLPVEELGTMLAFAQQKAKDTGQSIDYMVDSIVTGLGRKSLMILDNLGLSAAEIKEKMKETGDMTKAVGEIIREQMSKAGDYVETAADRVAKANVALNNQMLELGNTMQDVLGFSGWDELATKIKTEVVGALQFTIETIGEAKNAWNSFMQTIGVQEKPNKKSSGGSQRMADGTYWESTDAQGNITASGRWLNGKRVQTGLGDVVITPNHSPKQSTSRTTTRKAFDASVIAFNGGEGFKAVPNANFLSVWEMMGGDEGRRKMMGIGEQTRDWGKELGQVLADYIDDPDKEKRDRANKKQKDPIVELNKALSGLSSIRGGLEGIGVKLPAELEKGLNVVQGLISIIQGVQAVISIFSTSTETANTIAITANTVALGTLTSAVIANTATNFLPFANGGIVRAANGYVDGNTYSGDQIPALLNAGELVLNRSQQGVLASALNGGLGAMQLSAIITGEQIRLVLNNNGRRTGRGEYVTTNFK